MIRVSGLELSAGGNTLVLEGELHVRPAERMGLVGRNGSGKTTLLKLLHGVHAPEAGTVSRRGGLSTAWLPQEGVAHSTRTAWEEACRGMERINRLERQLEQTQHEVEQRVPGAIERLGEVTDAFRMAGGYAREEQVGEVLDGLGFRKEDWHRPCQELSGGWRVRVALARVLLSDAQVLLLDEPTNHLDIHARSWLAEFLERAGEGSGERAVVLVSHDRHLLDRVCTRMAEIRFQRLHVFPGNLTAWLRERDQRDERQARAHERQQRERERLQRFVDRNRAHADTASQARSRQRILDRMETVEAPGTEHRPHIRFPNFPPGAHEALSLHAEALGWPGAPPVLQDVALDLHPGMRVAVVGPNGAGKSTLVAGLAGVLAPGDGYRRLGKGHRIGLFSQESVGDLPGEDSPLEHLLARAPFATWQRARDLLGALGLGGDASTRLIRDLSGGERSRVALARLCLEPHSVLLLDEPTNHLDAVAVEVLVEALRAFDGVLVMATHDRFLVESVATHMAWVEKGAVELEAGVRLDRFARQGHARATASAVSTGEGRSGAGGTGDPAQAWRSHKRRAREVEYTGRRIDAVQERIEKLEGEIRGLDREVVAAGGDYERLARLARERDRAEGEVAELFEEWQELEEQREALALGLP